MDSANSIQTEVPSTDESKSPVDCGGVGHDSLEFDPVEPRLWSCDSCSYDGKNGSGGTKPAWHGSVDDVSFVSSKNVCKSGNKFKSN